MNIADFSIPKTSGCYLFKDEKEQIIYVGKSKFLPKRVKSYFQKNHQDLKTAQLVKEISSVDFISTESENEALVLEEDLIKLYKPKWNIKGKDDKTIRSLLVLSGGDWKKLELYFPKAEFSGEVLCQFTSSFQAREVIDICHQLFPLRTCSYDLSQENIEKGKFKPCLEWHIGKCHAPCIGLASKVKYLTSIKLIRDIFEFNFTTTRKFLTKEMKWFSKSLEFEKAAEIKNKLELLKKLEALLKPQLYKQKLDKASWIKEGLNLKSIPKVIDAFDNSHNQGADAVCGMTRFTLFGATKSDWRKFNIKSGAAGDDYGSFEEVLMRRFTRLLNEGLHLPNLVIIDGGRGQLHTAASVINRLGLGQKIDIISISKDTSHRPKTIHLVSGNEVPISGYKELAYILEECHRFSLHSHRVRGVKTLKESGGLK